MANKSTIYLLIKNVAIKFRLYESKTNPWYLIFPLMFNITFAVVGLYEYLILI